jgi:hypothetical protein
MGRPPCTNQSFVSADTPRGIHRFICSLEWFADGRTHVTRGHINWLPVTYEGFISFHSKSGDVGDDDYNFELEPLSLGGTGGAPVGRHDGLTRWNHVSANHRTLHVEMKGAETIRHMTNEWWVKFRSAVEGPAKNDDVAHSLVTGRPAIVTGLFGLDAEHKGHSEAHPIYAMAIQTSCSERPDKDGYYTDEWALFLRNYGNEGFCSGWTDQHRLDLNGNVFTFRLPLPVGAKSVQHTASLSANISGVVAGVRTFSARSAGVTQVPGLARAGPGPGSRHTGLPLEDARRRREGLPVRDHADRRPRRLRRPMSAAKPRVRGAALPAAETETTHEPFTLKRAPASDGS